MVRKGDTKTVQAVDSKGLGKIAGMKRATSDKRPELQNKRQKVTASSIIKDTSIPEGIKGADKPWVVDPDQVFRFLDLPGELRNRVYGFANDWSFRCFPMTYEKPKKSRRGKAASAEEVPIAQKKPLPYHGLTQVCSLIRTEFRPLWLSTHRFPLFALEGYFKVFFPVPRRSAQLNKNTQKRIRSYFDAAGTLRLWIRTDCLRYVDLLPLLRFRHRFPDYTITLVPALPTSADRVVTLAAFIHNANPTWVDYVKKHRITQIRMEVDHIRGPASNLAMRIVVKEKYAPSWMGSAFGRKPGVTEEYIKRLGLENQNWDIMLAVDYS